MEITAIYVEDSEEEALVMQLGMRRQQVQILHISDLPLNRIGELSQAPYDVAQAIILDAMLPSAGGLELAEALREMGDRRPIILLTAGENTDPDLLNRLDVRYMGKPPVFQTLAEMLRS
jgi:DNA-binding response OmpR family regulator